MSPTILTAAFEDAAEMIIGFGLVVLLPIIAIMTAHQRRMAEIIHRNQGPADLNAEVIARLDAMQREMAELRQRQNETILALEDRRSPSGDVQRRIQE